MQTTQHFVENSKEYKNHVEYFDGESEKEIACKMDNRLTNLEKDGHKLVSRQKVARNAPCPCASGKKFKRCCIGKVR